MARRRPGGGILTIPVANSDPLDGDVFVWRVSNRGERGLRPAEGSTITVEGFDGSTLCIEVFVLPRRRRHPRPHSRSAIRHDGHGGGGETPRVEFCGEWFDVSADGEFVVEARG